MRIGHNLPRRSPFGPASRLLFCGFCLLAASSCGAPALTLNAQNELSNKDYETVHEAWSRKDKSYGDFESLASAEATFISPTLLNAWLAEYQRVFAPVPAQMEEQRHEWQDRLEKQECLFLALTTQKGEWNDLASGASMWKLYLANDAGVKVPSSLVVPVKNKDTVFQHFFPQMAVFFDGYIVCFPKFVPPSAAPLLGPSTRWFEVELRSTVTKMSFRWELDASGK